MAGDVARELLILGILRRAPLSAYDVDRAVRGHAPLYRPLKHGNVYHVFARLAEARVLTQLVDLQSTDAALEVAYVLLGQLPREEALRLVAERRDVLVGHEGRLKRLFGGMLARGGSAYLAATHAVHRAKAEQKFLHDLVALLESPRWEPKWVTDDGPITNAERKL